MVWMELSLNTTAEAVDWVCSLLNEINYTGDVHIAKYTGSDSSTSVAQDLEQPQWAFTMSLYLAQDVYTNAYVDKMMNLLSPLQRTGLCDAPVMAVVDETTQVGEKNSLVHRIGKRFVVLTNELPYESEADDDVVIRLKTTLAFGSGLHPATILCLKLLERYVVPPAMNVLDLGSGSGILSIAMAKLGASVLAVDNDSVAVVSTQDAVHRNGVTEQVTVMKGSLGHGSNLGHWMNMRHDNVPSIDATKRFDLIVCNILARVHIALASDFRQALCHDDTSGGLVILAGFTADYEDAVDTALRAVGFKAIDCERSHEWVALAYQLRRQQTV
ncbi:MAG: 50S ribosomal protein L11 methyltransferase [Rhizonema sp. PD38]|nr:50S ribosomal protein L11 methyltransferase [Rhizonema sp. PD38]